MKIIWLFELYSIHFKIYDNSISLNDCLENINTFIEYVIYYIFITYFTYFIVNINPSPNNYIMLYNI